MNILKKLFASHSRPSAASAEAKEDPRLDSGSVSNRNPYSVGDVVASTTSGDLLRVTSIRNAEVVWAQKLGKEGGSMHSEIHVRYLSASTVSHQLPLFQPVTEKPSGNDGPVDRIFDEFGKDLPEDREVDDNLSTAIRLANQDGRAFYRATPSLPPGNQDGWAKAIKIFRDVQAKHPDYDVPYLWLAEYVRQNQGAPKAVADLREAATKCRRKSHLLAEAAELSLLECGSLAGACRFFAQAVGALDAIPDSSEAQMQGCVLILKEVFRCFGDQAGVRWAGTMHTRMGLDASAISQIRTALASVSEPTRSSLAHELSSIREGLCKMFPG